MMRIRRRFQRLARGSDDGFTLIELIVSLGMFAVALIAMSVMFTTAFRTARTAQNRDIAKNLVQQKIERLRTFPFYLAVRDQQAGTDPDLLDKYFPSLTPVGAPGETRTVDGETVQQFYVPAVSGACPQTSSPPACTYVTQLSPVPGLADSTLEIWAQFVREPDATTVTPAPATAAKVAQAPSAYDSNVEDQDAPPTKLVMVTMTVTWREGNRTRSFRSDSIIRGTRTTPVKASADGQASGGSVTGLSFQDGLFNADIVTVLGQSDGSVSEADFLSSIAKGLILEVSEVDPATNALIGPNQFMVRPTGAVSDSRNVNGQTSPAKTVSTGAQELRTLETKTADGTPFLISRIDSGSATSATQLGTPHPGDESRATHTASGFSLNFRSGQSELAQMNVDSITSSTTVNHTNSQISVASTATLGDSAADDDDGDGATGDADEIGIRLWGTHAFDGVAGYQGVVILKEINVSVTVTANGTPGGANARIQWAWESFRIWDPALNSYSSAGSCAYDSAIHGANYPACAGAVLIPAAYGTPLPGETAENCTTCSLAVTVGSTQFASLPTGLGADAFQKNVLNIFFKNQGVNPLTNSTFALGDATARVTYNRHH